ncbi:MAG: FUSC family protein [Microbacterium ginsengisoli]|nr:FUSC family protein [Microbacterium ginsengisoli]
MRPVPTAFDVRSATRPSLLQVGKSAVAVAVAWLLAGWLVHGPAPVFAAIAALLVVQPSLNQSVARAIERSVGVIAGVVLASVLGIAFGRATAVVLVAAAVGLLLAWSLRMTVGTANQIAISAILVLSLGATTPEYAVDRIIETVIGAIVGIIANLAIVPPVALAPAREQVRRLREELALSFERLADALDHPPTAAGREELMIGARLLRPVQSRASDALAAASESLTFNPRGRSLGTQVAALRDDLDVFTPIVTQLIGMTRAVYDHASDDATPDPALPAIAVQLRRVAHDVRLTGEQADAAPQEPALTAPLELVQPGPQWILVGAMLEDLKRVHLSLTERA